MPKAVLRYFNIILRFVPIKLHFNKEKTLFSPLYCLKFPVIPEIELENKSNVSIYF